MAVYIDNFNAPFGRMKMCHMIADTTDELLEMVDKIGVHRRWIQYRGTPNEHFDICLAKKKIAVAFGAKEINFRDYGRMVQDRCPHTETVAMESGGKRCTLCVKSLPDDK